MECEYSKKQVCLMNLHCVWCPKRRKKVLVGNIATMLREILEQLAQEKQVKILALEIQPDHLHLFVSISPQTVVHKLVKAFKGRSSNILRKEYPSLLKLPAIWTNSYFVSTVGNVSSETIRKYIEAQATV